MKLTLIAALIVMGLTSQAAAKCKDAEEPPAVQGLTEENHRRAAQGSDFDEDGWSNYDDNCPTIVNPEQNDSDGDRVGDLCDLCPEVAAPGLIDGCPETPEKSL